MNIARLRDVSVSGAFLETGAILRTFSSVDVQFRTHRGGSSRVLSAHVVRTTPDGVGVEWREFAPREVSRLMETYPDHVLRPERGAGRDPAPRDVAAV
jgi:hypothetical protein